MFSLIFLKVYFINYAIIVVPSSPPLPPLPGSPLHSNDLSPLSSCPWVVHVSSLGSPLPILFLTFPCLFCTYPIMLLTHYTFSPILLLPLPAGNPPNGLHIYDYILILVVCLVCFCFLDSIVDSCVFVVILMFIVLIFFFLNKSL